MARFVQFVLLFMIGNNSFAQETFPVNGVVNKNHNCYAFTNAKIIIDYQTAIDNATLLIKDGIIVQAANNVVIPKGSIVYDLKGKTIYPSFIDIYSNYGMPEIKKGQRGFGPQMESKMQGAYA